MGNDITRAQLYQLAQAELKKSSKYKNRNIPETEIQAKINELSKLSQWEIQAKFNDFFKAKPIEKDGWAIFGLDINSSSSTNNNNTLISPDEPDTRKFAIELLSSNANNALQAVKNYHNSIGYISTDAVAQGLNVIGNAIWDTITGRNDFLPLVEQETNIEHELNTLEQLKNQTTTRAQFHKGFKDLYGIDFNPTAFKKLQEANKELSSLNANEALEKYFDYGINEIKKDSPDNAGFKINALLNPIFNNPLKTQDFINDIKKDCKSDEEFKAKLIQTLTNAKNEATKSKNKILKTTTRENLENNYKSAYKDAMGNYHAEEIVQQYLETQQTQAMYTETAIIMATSMLTMGSSAVKTLAAKTSTSLGTKVAGHVVKAGMTTVTASLPAAETVVSGLTSKNGDVNWDMAGEQLKNGIIFGSFGAYVSAPLGDKLVSLLKANPKITSAVINKIFSGVGFGTEVGLDALFEMSITKGEMGQLFKENAQGELLGRFMHMILGGQAHHATKSLMDDIAIKQEVDQNGKTLYSLTQQGKTLYQTDSPENLIAGIAAIAGEAQGVKLQDVEKPTPKTVKPKNNKVEFPETPLMDVARGELEGDQRLNKVYNKPHFQKEISKCLDAIIEKLDTKILSSPPKEHQAPYTDVMLPDGTILSENRLKDPAKGEVTIYARDINGKEYFLTATESNNKKKAAKILDYMAHLPIVPRDMVNEIQAEIRAGKTQPEAFKIVEERHKKAEQAKTENLYNKIAAENKIKPAEYLVKTAEAPEFENITLSLREKTEAKAKGIPLDIALKDKKLEAIYEANATYETQENVAAHLKHLTSRLITEKSLNAETTEVPFYRPVKLADGTTIMREVVPRSSTSYINGIEIRGFNEPYEIISVITSDGKKEFYPTILPFADAEASNLLDVMGKAIAAEKNQTPTTPAGMDSAEDLAIRRAKNENPAEKVSDKVKKQWTETDIETKTPEETVDLFNLDQNAGLKQPTPDVKDEVTSLIFTDKLKEKLTQRYEEMGKVFEEIISKNMDEIKSLAKENGNNKQAYAEGIVKILSREFGLEGFEPKIEFTDTKGATGLANWYDGTIQIDKYTNNAKKLTSIISHEFVHMLQFRDVLAQYGEKGVREMIMNDKSIPADKKDFWIDRALNNDFTKNLLDSYDLQKAQTGSINDYIIRVYKDEFTNTVIDGAKYPDQTTEREAYHLGSGKIGDNTKDLDDVELKKSDWEVKEGDIQEINGQKFRINSDGTITRLSPKGPAGYTPTTEADYRTATQKLCYDDIGTYHHDAKELSDAINNSKLYEENWNPFDEKLNDLQVIAKTCKIDGHYDTYFLSSAKEMVELAGQKEDKYLRQSSAYMIEQILNSIKKLPDEAQIEAVNATKELLTNEKVRNSVIDSIILSCIDNGCEFNKDAFRKIYDYHKEVEATSHEDPYSYSLRVAETAKTSSSYVKDANGNWKKVFDDAVFEVAKLYASSANFVHIDLSFCRNRDTEEFHFSQLPDFVKEKMVKTLPEKIEKDYATWEKHNLQEALDACKIDGKYDAENLFALYYMKNVLKINTHDINKYITQLKNQNGKVDISMLNLIKRAGNSINKNNDAHRILELGANLYNKDGKVQNQEVETMLDSYAINFIKYIKDDIITDGRINIEKFKEIDTKLKDIHSKLQQLGFRKDSNDEVFRIFNKGKADPKAIDEIYSLLEKLPNEYIPNAFKNFRDFIFTYKSDGKDGVDIDKLRYYAEMPTDLLKVAYHNYSIDNYLQGEPLVVDYYIEHLKSNEIEILEKHGIKIDYLKESNANKNNRTIKTTPEQQQRFENTLNLLDETLAKVNISEGIELAYSKSQLDKEINDIVKDLPERTKTELLNLYGLSISDGIVHGVACMPKTEAPDNLKEKANAIKNHIKNYLNNTVKTDNPDLKAIYDSLTKDFPEFSMLVGKIGNDGQRVDTTVLKQLQTITTSDSYKSLSAEDKKLAKLAIMFNAFKDIDANPNSIEKHFSIDNDGLMFDKVATRAKNAEFANFILKRFDLTETEKYRLTELISNIGWSEAYKNGKVTPMEIAVNTRFGDIELAKVIEDTVNPKNDVDLKPIKDARTKLFQNVQVLNASTYEDLKPYFKKGTLCGVECEILDLRTTKLPEDSTLLMHVTEKDLTELHDLLNNENDKVFLSNSLVNANKANTFAGRTKGIVSEFDNINVAQSHYYNIDSGFGKDYARFVKDISSDSYKDIAFEVKKTLRLSDEDYGILMEKIYEYNSFNDIPDCTINGRLITQSEIKQAHTKAYQELVTRGTSEQNEITILNQKPFAYVYKASSSWYGEDGEIANAMQNTGLKRVIILP